MTRTIQQLPNLLVFRAFDGIALLENESMILPNRSAVNQTAFNVMFHFILGQLNFEDQAGTNTDSLEIMFANNFFRDKKIPISQESINLIIERCRGDRENINNEISKIESFIQYKKKITT